MKVSEAQMEELCPTSFHLNVNDLIFTLGQYFQERFAGS